MSESNLNFKTVTFAIIGGLVLGGILIKFNSKPKQSRNENVESRQVVEPSPNSESNKSETSTTKKASEREWRVCNNCTGNSCSKCSGRGYYFGLAK